MYTNEGSKNFTQMAPFNFLPREVHFNTYLMENILVIKDFSSIPGLQISTDSRKERAVILKYKNQIIKFQECLDGLYYYYTTNKCISHVNYYDFKAQ